MTERWDLCGGETEKKQRDRQTYEAGEVWDQRECRETKGEERRERVSNVIPRAESEQNRNIEKTEIMTEMKCVQYG